MSSLNVICHHCRRCPALATYQNHYSMELPKSQSFLTDQVGTDEKELPVRKLYLGKEHFKKMEGLRKAPIVGSNTLCTFQQIWLIEKKDVGVQNDREWKFCMPVKISL